jgi:hypothetical protein
MFHRFVANLQELVKSTMPFLVVIGGLLDISLFFYILNVIEVLDNLEFMLVLFFRISPL